MRRVSLALMFVDESKGVAGDQMDVVECEFEGA